MRCPIRAISLISLLSATLLAQITFPSDTVPVFGRHTLARLGGSKSEVATAIKVGSNGEIYIAGNTTSSDFPTKNAAQPRSPEAAAMLSADGGRTWTRFTPPPVNTTDFQNIPFLRAHPSVPGLLFAAAGTTLWRSADAGETWQSSYIARPRDNTSIGRVVSIGFDQLAPTTVYLMSTDGFSVSQDGGIHWQTKAERPGYPFSFGYSSLGETRIENDPRGSGAIIANAGSPILSRDGGATWTALRVPAGQTSSVATFSRTRNGRIYSGVGAGASGSLWVSDDWGQTWTPTKAQPDRAVVDLFTDPEAPNRLYAMTLRSLRVSEDGAESWTQTDSSVLLGSQVSRTTGCDSGALLVTTQGFGQLTFSPDIGQTWQASSLRDVQKFAAGAGCSVYALKNVSGDAFVARVDGAGEIAWSTYLADIGLEAVTALTTDNSGNVLVTGTVGTITDILLAKYTSDGRLLWKKTLGGSSWDTPSDITADAAGDIIIAGRTSSENLPVTPGAARNETGYGFAMKLNPSGDLIWATYLEDAVQSLAVEPSQSILLAGSDRLLRVDGGGASITVVSTPVARPAIVRTDTSGNVFLAGTVLPTEAPVTPGAYASSMRARSCGPISWGPSSLQPRGDLQVARLRAGSLEPEFSALLGGECGSRPDSLDVDSEGRVTIGFVTQSQAFDVRASVASAGFCGFYDLATGVAQLSPDGSQLLRSTLLDGCSQIRAAVSDSAIYTTSDNTEDALVLRVDRPLPQGPRLDRVTNAFSGTGFGITPGGLVSLSGADLGPTDAVDLGLNPQKGLPSELGGTQVLVNGAPVPLLRVAPEQVIFTAPFRIDGKSATVQVQRNGQLSNEVLVPVIPSNPGLLAVGFPFTDPESAPPANARNADGTLNSPSNPAPLGSTVWVFATGLGATNPEVESGRTASTEALRPVALFRETRDVPFSYSPIQTPSGTTDIHAMPGFLNSIFAMPVIARESNEQPGRQLVSITSAQYLRGTNRRSFSAPVTLYVCGPDTCPAQ